MNVKSKKPCIGCAQMRSAATEAARAAIARDSSRFANAGRQFVQGARTKAGSISRLGRGRGR